MSTPSALPNKMDPQERLRIRSAAYRTRRVLPPGLAELVAREFLAWEEFGYQFGPNSVVMRAINEIMKCPISNPDFLAPEDYEWATRSV
jgi:hypothetical protein